MSPLAVRFHSIDSQKAAGRIDLLERFASADGPFLAGSLCRDSGKTITPPMMRWCCSERVA
jgi:hypothetical protein